uniref:TPR_REGION domain-containing protein n=1 Tax=Macrostomum lignano TaxID=282301 RepID=A0A1I8J163_9PLAT
MSIRARLKSANEALSAERFDEAAELCQAVLKDSPDNYNANIFLGAAYEGLKRDDEALACYRKATTDQPKQLLGWKAMAKYCESHYDRHLKQELPDVYDKVLELTDPTDARHAETLAKLIELLCRQRQSRRAVDTGQFWLTRYTTSEARVRVQLQLLDVMEKASEGELFSQFESVLSLPKSALASSCATAGAESSSADRERSPLQLLHDRYCDFLAKRGADPERRLRALSDAVNECPDDVEAVDRLAFARAELCIVCHGWRLTKLAKHLGSVEVSGSVAVDFSDQVVSPAIRGKLTEALAALRSPRWSLPPAPIEAAVALSAPSGSIVSALVGVLCAKASRRYADCSAALQQLQSVADSVSQHRKICCLTSGARHLLDGWSRRIGWRCLACYADEQLLTAGELEAMSAQAAAEDFTNQEDIQDWSYWVSASLSIALGRLGRLEKASAVWPSKRGLIGRRVQAFLAFQAGDWSRARDLLDELINLGIEEADSVEGVGLIRRRPWDRLMLARCMWALNQEPAEIAAQLRRCTEEDRYYADAYYWYGCLAEDAMHDEALAEQMYLGAQQLDGDHEAALKRLCDLLLRSHRETECVELLTRFAARFYRVAPWCYFKLGLAHLNMANYHDAIDCLQRVVHLDKSNPHAWTCLGEAYRLRGSYESAGKVFERVVKLAPNDWYSRLQLASVLHKQRQFLRAVSLLNQLLSEEDAFGASADCGDSQISLKLLAYKQLSESHLQLGVDCSGSGQHLSAAEHLALAANAACEAVHINNNLVCVWKLLGDSLYRLGVYESALLNELPFSEQLNQLIPNGTSCQSRVLQGCTNAYASRLNQAQAMAAKGQSSAGGSLLESNARLDCALVLLRVFRVSAETATEASRSGGRESEVLNSATEHCLCSLKLRPDRPDVWYIMGLIETHRENRALAQHCFIKSLQLDPGQADVWTALGLFYCQLYKLEHGAACFNKAVDADPTSSAAWAGCAVAARLDGRADQTRDLLRHACSLANPPLEALRGFVRCVALEITGREELPTENSRLAADFIDALSRLAVPASESAQPLAQTPRDRLALLNHRLLCLERLGLMKEAANTALDLFSLALDDMRLAEGAAEAAAAAPPESSLELRATVSNCLRCLSLAGRYEEVAANADYLRDCLGSDLSAQDLCYIGFSIAKLSTRDAPDAYEQLELASSYFCLAVERVTHSELAGSVWATFMAAAEHLSMEDTAKDAMRSALERAPADVNVVRCVLAYVSHYVPAMVPPGLTMLRDLLPPGTADSDPQIGLTEVTEALLSGDSNVAIATALRLTRCSAEQSQAAGWIAALRTLATMKFEHGSKPVSSLKSLGSVALFDRCLRQLDRIKVPAVSAGYLGRQYLDEVAACLSVSPLLKALCTGSNLRSGVRVSLKHLCASWPSHPALSDIVDAVRV